MTPTYISSLKILSFQNFQYFEIPLLINLFFSTDFKSSFPQIGWKGIGFGIPLRYLGQP